MESAIAGDKRSDEERIQDEIDGVAEDIPDIVPAAKESRKRKDRPDNWKDSTDEAVVYRNILVYVDATSDADANADIESDENQKYTDLIWMFFDVCCNSIYSFQNLR